MSILFARIIYIVIGAQSLDCAPNAPNEDYFCYRH